MNIILDGAERQSARVHTNADKGTTSYRTPDTAMKADNSGFALDISGTVMDNSAYKGHGRTAEEVMLEAEQVDIVNRRNYMAVMSNSMSDEDFAKLQKEGVHPGSTQIETVVTIVDRIKTALVKGGTQVAGYTDTVDYDTLKEITGSEAFARELADQFTQKDIPVTEENVAAVMEAWNTLEETGTLTDGSIKYMVENQLSPTPDNLYTAKYSAAAATRGVGKGYYCAGEVAGYYAEKPETVDFEQILPQVEKLLEQSGYTADEASLDKARWLIEQGIPLNGDTFSLLKEIGDLSFPVSREDFLQSAASAMADGKRPGQADLNKKETNYELAVSLEEKTKALSDETADLILARELPFTLKNLFAAQNGFLGADPKEEKMPVNVQGRRLLEEVRLSMTTQANLRLLRSGYQIETAELKQLVEDLKTAEEECARALTGEADKTAAKEKTTVYLETLDVLWGIRTSPTAILTDVSGDNTLKEIEAQGAVRALAYEKAGQSYETLMTAPRQDMGDSITKAFRNVDDILADMDMEFSKENRRAVRILGYNSIEITEENIKEVKEMDGLLTDVVEGMKPGVVLNMIRDGINPLSMPLSELQEYLEKQEDPEEDMESYSRFLYKLEKQKGISEEERSAYIGIYRLLRQIEKTDDAAVGALWQTGAGYTLENLLSMVRTGKHKAMNYTVGDDFGGVDKKDSSIESITSQIEKGFIPPKSTLKKELEQVLLNAGDEEAGEEFDRMLNEQIRTAVRSEDAVWQQLENYGQPITPDNLLMAAEMMKTPGNVWQRLQKLHTKDDPEADLKETGKKLLNALEGKEPAQRTYTGFCEEIQDMLEEESYQEQNSFIDVRAMSVLHKQMSYLNNMAREENYEIPVDIDGSLTSINLKIIHGGEKESKVAITLREQTFGEIAAEFKETAKGLEGFCICKSREGVKALQQEKELLEEKLEKEGISTGEIYFAQGENLELTEFSLKQSAGRKEGQDAKVLYRAAKAFISYIQKTATKKGSIENEN